MKIICIGDIHASGFGDDPLVENLPERLYYIKKSLEFIMDYGKNNGIKEYVILGDVYHDKTIIYNISQAMMIEFFTNHSDCHFRIISGNHDLSSTGENQKSAIQALDELENVECFIKDVSVQELDYCSAAFVPFTNMFVEDIKKYGSYPSNCKILFAHLVLNEAVLQSGLSRVDKVKLNDLKQFKLAILGHYHKPQDFHNEYTHVWYTGSLIPRDWNDKNESKRFLVVDTETLEVNSVDITGVPLFVEIVIPPNSTEEHISAELCRANRLRKEGHKVRVINKNKSRIKQEDISDVILLEQQEIDVTNRGITVEQSKIDQCKKYMEIKEIPENERAEYLKVLSDSKLLEIIEQ